MGREDELVRWLELVRSSAIWGWVGTKTWSPEKRGFAGEVHLILSGYRLMTSAQDSGDVKLRGGSMDECIQSERGNDVPRGAVSRDHSWEVN